MITSHSVDNKLMRRLMFTIPAIETRPVLSSLSNNEPDTLEISSSNSSSNSSNLKRCTLKKKATNSNEAPADENVMKKKGS